MDASNKIMALESEVADLKSRLTRLSDQLDAVIDQANSSLGKLKSQLAAANDEIGRLQAGNTLSAANSALCAGILTAGRAHLSNGETWLASVRRVALATSTPIGVAASKAVEDLLDRMESEARAPDNTTGLK